MKEREFEMMFWTIWCDLGSNRDNTGTFLLSPDSTYGVMRSEPEATVGMECSPVDGTVVSWYPFHNMFLPPTLPPRYPGVFVAIYLGIIEHRHTLTDWRPGSFSSPLSLSLCRKPWQLINWSTNNYQKDTGGRGLGLELLNLLLLCSKDTRKRER